MNERDVVYQITQNVLRYIDVDRDLVEDFFTRIQAMKDDELPALRAMIVKARAELLEAYHGRMHPDEAIANVVRESCTRVGIRGFEKGMYVGYFQENMLQPNVQPLLPQLVRESLGIIDQSGVLSDRSSKSSDASG